MIRPLPNPTLIVRLSLCVVALAFVGCGRSDAPQGESRTADSKPVQATAPCEMNDKTDDPSQQISSSVTRLRLKRGEPGRIPVTVMNQGRNRWCSAGAFPVHISYRWIANSRALPDEGVRTKLAAPLGPGESADLELIIAPPSKPSREMTLVITALQEGNAWFDGVGGKPLRVPVDIVAE